MTWLEKHWERFTPVSALLSPVSFIFRAVSGLRRAGYRSGLLSSSRLSVPVIIVGNLTAGGTGKTPLVLWLASFLKSHGRNPGIVCRGYGGRQGAPREVRADSDPYVYGDEAVLLARRSGCPVWTGVDRPAAARSLLDAYPCDIVLSDDGLQHYALDRDLEICVIDAERGFGNGWLLPAGPLREPPARLAEVDAVIVNGADTSGATRSLARKYNSTYLGMSLESREFRNLLHADRRVEAEFFRGKRVHGVAGIGNPARFFRQLRELGIEVEPHAFPDHHAFQVTDLAFNGSDAIVMTEKDAVKCERFPSERCWVLTIDARPERALETVVTSGLDAATRLNPR